MVIYIVLIVILILFLVQNIKQRGEIKNRTQEGNKLKDKIVSYEEKITILENDITQLNEENSELNAKIKELIGKNSMLEYQTYHLRAQSHTLKNLAQNVQDSISHLYRRSSDITDIMGMLSFKTANSNRYISVEEETKTIAKYARVIRDIKNIKGTCLIDTDGVDTSSPLYKQDCILEFVSFPLVENAFQHGNTKADDFLHIKYSLFHDIFTVEVKNKVNEFENDEERKKYSGQGIEILRHRLEQFYPNQYKLESSKQKDEYQCFLQIYL